MAEIAYIHGLPAQMTESERKQRGREVPSMKPIDYLRMTEGEMRLALVAEQLNILRNYYRDTPAAKEYDKGFELVTDAMAAGIHGAIGMGAATGSGGILRTVVQQIRFAKRATAPAAGRIYTDKRKSIGAGLVPLLDCNELYPMSEAEWNATTHNPSGYAGYHQAQTEKLAHCRKENDWRELLNDDKKGLEKIAHHPLYEFIDEKQAAMIAQAKKGKPLLHSIAIDNLSSLSTISRSNIRLWQRNGVMRENSFKGAGPISPEYSINGLYQERQRVALESGVGVIMFLGTVLTVKVVVAILAAVTAALSAAAQFIAMLKAKQPTAGMQYENAVQGWGGQNYASGPDDFISTVDANAGTYANAGNEFFKKENMPILLAAGAGLLLLTSK